MWPQVAAFFEKCLNGGDGGERGEDDGDDGDDEKPSSTAAPATASSSSSSSRRPPPLPKPRLFLDIGCGNGKYLHLAPRGTAMLACEPCQVLASAAAEAAAGNTTSTKGKGFGSAPAKKAPASCVCVARADGIAMPYRKGMFDGIICIAVRRVFF